MKFQTRSYTCGPAAMVNALRLYGFVDVPEATVGRAAGTTNNGTSDRGIVRGFRKMGVKTSVVKLTSTIWKRAAAGVPVILHLDDAKHWVLVIGVLGPDLVVFDSDMSLNNQRENGVKILSQVTVGKHACGICVYRPASGSFVVDFR